MRIRPGRDHSVPSSLPPLRFRTCRPTLDQSFARTSPSAGSNDSSILGSLAAMSAVLDAGCGYALAVDFPRTVWLVGLDASPEALAKNQKHRRIPGRRYRDL